MSVVERGEGCFYDLERQAVKELFVFIREVWQCPPLADQRRWGSLLRQGYGGQAASNPGVYRMGAIGIGSEWLRGKRPFPGARFPSWEPIAPAGLLGLLSSRALSVPAVKPTGNIGCADARAIARPIKKSTFAQIDSVHFCSARHSLLTVLISDRFQKHR